MTIYPPVPRDVRLGRHRNFDDKSRGYPIRTLLPTMAAPRSYTWRCRAHLDQGQEGSCVGFGITAELAARPVEVGLQEADATLARLIYHEAQKIDPWPGEDYEGTDVLSGVKVCTRLGYYTGYRWCFSIQDVALTLGYKGPVVLGIPWYEQMFGPDVQGIIGIGGGYAGDHCILAGKIQARFNKGVLAHERSWKNLDQDASLIDLHNSWGAQWGLDGSCRISVRNLATLLKQGGEGCVPLGRSDPAGDPAP